MPGDKPTPWYKELRLQVVALTGLLLAVAGLITVIDGCDPEAPNPGPDAGVVYDGDRFIELCASPHDHDHQCPGIYACPCAFEVL